MESWSWKHQSWDWYDREIGWRDDYWREPNQRWNQSRQWTTDRSANDKDDFQVPVSWQWLRKHPLREYVDPESRKTRQRIQDVDLALLNQLKKGEQGVGSGTYPWRRSPREKLKVIDPWVDAFIDL